MVHLLRTARCGNTLAAGAIGLIALAGVCPAQIQPQPPEMAARVVELTGQVSVLHGSDPWALNTGDWVQVRQVIVTGPDGYARFDVSDGSSFEVFQNSTVTFRKNPPNWRDLLDVFVGRVKIHIQRWGNQPNPNRILTPTAVISVRGTTFDVSVDPENESTLIAVEEGQVQVRHALIGGETKTINAGESLQIYREQPLANSMVDRGAVAQRVLRALADALYTIATSRGPVKIPSGCSACSGQTPPLTPPPPPPPPAAPPPPGH